MTNPLNGAIFEIQTRSIWQNGKNAFIDIRVKSTNANSQNHQSPTKVLKKHEKEKKRQYSNCVMNTELATVSPLVFSD